MEKRQYQIQYTDNTYRMVDWTQDEFKLVCECIVHEALAAVLEDGIFVLHDIRAIVLIPLVPEEPEQEENQLPEWGFVDHDTAEWLKANGIDLGGKSK